MSLERLSRLKARLLPELEERVAVVTRRGRPCRSPSPEGRIGLLAALLAVAASLIQQVPVRRRPLQAQLVQACQRLQGQYRLSVKSFCAFLGLKERTFREWRRRPAPPASLPECAGETEKKSRSARSPGRFDLEQLLPGIQVMGDTTELTVLGVPLKLVGLQDPGDRNRRRLTDFGLYEQERAIEIVEVISTRLGSLAGTQVITDQGKPYLAELARKAYEDIELDHAPQKEATPTAKATLERAFGVVKQALRPLLDLSDRIAQRLPSLHEPELARSLGRLLVAVYLRVYLTATKNNRHPLEEASTERMRLVAEQQREQARQEENSKRLLLEHLHDAYDMEGSKPLFVRSHRLYGLEDIRQADRILRDKACRCLTRACDRYFTGILRNVAEKGRARRARLRTEQLEQAKRRDEQEQIDRHKRMLFDTPQMLFQEGLDWLAAQWLPERQQLSFSGYGPGRTMLRQATERLAQKDPWGYSDQIHSLWTAWKLQHPDTQPGAAQAIQTLMQDSVAEYAKTAQPSSPEDCARAILRGGKPPLNTHSPPR